MAKGMKMRAGSSGSPKHTEVRGDGRNLMGMGKSMGTVGKSETGPRIGAGVMGKRVTADYDRNRDGDSGRARGSPKGAYSEE